MADKEKMSISWDLAFKVAAVVFGAGTVVHMAKNVPALEAKVSSNTQTIAVIQNEQTHQKDDIKEIKSDVKLMLRMMRRER